MKRTHLVPAIASPEGLHMTGRREYCMATLLATQGSGPPHFRSLAVFTRFLTSAIKELRILHYTSVF
jgi:hypothetical protein